MTQLGSPDRVHYIHILRYILNYIDSTYGTSGSFLFALRVLFVRLSFVQTNRIKILENVALKIVVWS